MEEAKINELAKALEDAIKGPAEVKTNKALLELFEARMAGIETMEGQLRTFNMLEKAVGVIQLIILGRNEEEKKQLKASREEAQELLEKNNFTPESLAGRKAIINAKEEIICPYMIRDLFDIVLLNFKFVHDELPEEASQADIELCLRYSVKLMLFALEGISKIQEIVFELAEKM